MSLSNPTANAVNPSQKFIEFRDGGFRYYDKLKKENVSIPLPITFTVLDELSTVTGYDEPNKCGIFSNEVWSLAKTKLLVKSFKGGEIAHGYYSAIKDTVKANGGRYTKSVYAYMDGEIVNFKFSGACVAPWIDKKFDVTKNSVKVEKLGEGKKGKTEYQFPIFEKTDFVNLEKATEADRELQKYLTEKIGSPKSEPIDDHLLDEPPPDQAVISDEPWEQ